MSCRKSTPGTHGPALVVGASAKEGATSREEDEAEAVRVRKPSGDVVVALDGRKLQGLSISSLRGQVSESMGRTRYEVQLVAEGRPLEDAELIEPLAKREQVLEIIAIARELPRLDPFREPIEQLDILKQMVFCHAFEKRLEGMRHFRKLLGIEGNSPSIDQVLELGLMPRFIECSSGGEHPKLQHEALWVLTNIASGTAEQTRAIVEHGALATFVEQLSSPDSDVLEQAVWGLGNIAGNSPECCLAVLDAGAMEPLVALLRSTEKVSALRNEAWCLSNLCRGIRAPAWELVAPAIPVLAHVLSTAADEEVLTDLCWAVSYLLDAGSDCIQAVVNAGVCPHLARLLAHEAVTVLTPALRAVGKIITGDDGQTQAVLDAGVLPRFAALVSHATKSIRKGTCRAISNVVAGTQDQVQEVIDAGLLPAVLELADAQDYDIQREAHHAISNLVNRGTAEQIGALVGLGVVRLLVAACLGLPELRQQALQSITRILRAGRTLQESGAAENPYKAEILRREGVNWLERVEFEEGDEYDFICSELIDGADGAQTESSIHT